MKDLTEIINKYDIELIHARDGYILHLKYSYKDEKFVNVYFVGETIKEIINKTLHFIREKENAGFYL